MPAALIHSEVSPEEHQAQSPKQFPEPFGLLKLGQLFCDAQKRFATVHFAPDFFGSDAQLGPQYHEVVHQIGTFADE